MPGCMPVHMPADTHDAKMRMAMIWHKLGPFSMSQLQAICLYNNRMAYYLESLAFASLPDEP